jgi:L-aspartate oxidase
MEFIQFHPTAMAVEEETTSAFLISEAVRGHGAYLKNKKGERFLFHYHSRAELACRDVVAKAIASELYSGEQQFVYLDCTHIAENFEVFFPTIYHACAQRGIDVKHDFIPVAPAAHYVCGGIDVDVHGKTSIQHLYACGECSNTGLHGANRLASNSLLEALVYSHACFRDIERSLAHIKIANETIDDIQYTLDKPNFSTSGVRLSLQNLMTKHVGIMRCNDGLHYALQEINALEKEMGFASKPFYCSPSWCEVRNMITCAKLIVEQSLARRENRGVFFNKDL